MRNSPNSNVHSLQVPAPGTERTALKEWAVLVDAMARGDFIAMIRKGGIREQRAGFSVRHDRFLLYPTFFHEKALELEAGLRLRLAESHENRPAEGIIRLTFVAEVKASWRVTELDRLRAIQGEHGLSWEAVEARFNYKNKPGVHVVAVATAALPAAVELPEARRYQGCVSWVELDAGVDVSAARPLHSGREVAARVSRLAAELGPPSEMADART